MPELPEVEVVVRTLKKQILNRKIIKTEVLYEPIVQSRELFQTIEGKIIIDIERKGKYIIFILSDDLVIVGHFRMEGKIQLRKINDPITKHQHFILYLDDGMTARYQDFRKFGRFIVKSKEVYLKEKPLSELGDEPADIDIEKFYNSVHKRQIEIKKVLLDQSVIAGLGNIYVNEVLFESKIHPEVIASQLSKEEVKRIVDNSIKIFDEAIIAGGTTISTYESSLGVHGSFQDQLVIHGKIGSPCPYCHTPIIRIKIGGRGTYVCPNCQKK